MTRLDPRLHPVRPDLAAASLRGRVVAPAYAEGRAARIGVGHAALRRAPADDAPMDTEVLFGEAVTVYERRGGWAWLQCALDGYVGYVRADALAAADGPAPDLRVAVPRTWVYPAPDIKAPPRRALPMHARLAAAGTEGRFVRTAEGFVIAAHLCPLAEAEPDHATVAEGFLGAPYLWGGKTWSGLDCSGLVQVALAATGLGAPRDTDLQQAALGEPVAGATPRRGDLVFWPGHVGVMLDPATLLHANAHHMRVAREPLAEARARIGAAVATIRRLRG